MIFRNIMYAAESDNTVLKAVVPHAIMAEHALMKVLNKFFSIFEIILNLYCLWTQHLHQLSSFQTRQSHIFGNHSSVVQSGDVLSSSRVKQRRSSAIRRSSVKYAQKFVSEEIEHEVVQQQEIDLAASPNFSQELHIRKVEQSDAIIEMLWLMQSSRVFNKVLKKTGTHPNDRIASFASTLAK